MRAVVRHTRLSDIPDLLRLYAEVYPAPKFPETSRWKAPNLKNHLDVFPEGQFVALLDGEVVGSSNTHITTKEDAFQEHTWSQITARGSLSTHDPDGDVLYGVDICVSPRFRRRGVGSALYRARFELQRRRRLRHFVAGARIPGYSKYADCLTPTEYLEEVRAGRLYDRTLSFQLSRGFRAVRVLPGYERDPETDSNSVLIVRPLQARRPRSSFVQRQAGLRGARPASRRDA